MPLAFAPRARESRTTPRRRRAHAPPRASLTARTSSDREALDLVVGEEHPHHPREHVDVLHAALAARGHHPLAVLGEQRSLLAVERVFVDEAAHEAAADARHALGVQREPLLLRVADGHRRELAEEGVAAELQPARADAADGLGRVAHAHVAQLHAPLEGGAEALRELPELHALLAREVDHGAPAAEPALRPHDLHGESQRLGGAVGGAHGLGLPQPRLLLAAQVGVGGAAQAAGGGALRQQLAARRRGDGAHLDAALGLHHHRLAAAEGDARGVTAQGRAQHAHAHGGDGAEQAVVGAVEGGEGREPVGGGRAGRDRGGHGRRGGRGDHREALAGRRRRPRARGRRGGRGGRGAT